METFRRKFDVPFPVFPDRTRAVADQFGRARLPCMLVVCNRTPTPRLLHQHNGTLGDPEDFLDLVLRTLQSSCPDRPGQSIEPVDDCGTDACDPASPGHPNA